MEYLGISEEASVIHEKLSDFTKKTLDFYDFGNLNPDKLFKEINDVIESHSVFGKTIELREIKKDIIVRIKELIKENLKTQKIEIISRFIDKFNDKNIHKVFNMLLYFLKQNDEFLTQEECKLLLNVNTNLKYCIEKWIKDYTNKDKELPFELMYYNPNFITMIKTYCFENNLSYTNILSKFGKNKKEKKISVNDLNPVDSSTFFNLFDKVNLSKNQFKYLGFEILAGNEEAKEQLIKHNILLSYSIAKKYNQGIIPFDDILQTGNEGLITAANKFDVTINETFSTYATYWIRQKISRFLVTQLPLTISQNAYNDLREYNKEVDKFFVKNGYEPSLHEISEILGWTLEKTFDIHSLMKKTLNIDTTEERFDAMYNKQIVDPFDSDIETIFDNIEIRALMPKWFEKAKLTDIEKEVLIRHYGINCEPETYETIGKDHLVSRQRIEQLHAKAFDKLRKVNEIHEYFDAIGRHTKAR